MAGIFSNVGSNVQPYELSDEEFQWIGRIIRATAELEDILKEYLCKLMGLEMGAVIILFGRMPARARLGIAEMFAQGHGGDTLKDYEACFGRKDLKDLLKCRNTVAHGALCGKAENGRLAFEVADLQGMEETSVNVTVRAYSSSGLRAIADEAENMITEFEERLKLKSLLAERRAQSLLPHVKARGPQKPRKSPKPRP